MTASNLSLCPVCSRGLDGAPQPDSRDVYGIRCAFCGSYGITSEAFDDVVPRLDRPDRAALAVFLRERSLVPHARPIVLCSEHLIPEEDGGRLRMSIREIVSSHPLPPVHQRPDRALLNLSRLNANPSASIQVAREDVALLCAEDLSVAIFVLESLGARGHLRADRGKFTITMEGWKRLWELEHQGLAVKVKQAFVAMWLDAQMDKVFMEGIKPAIEEAGFQPLRIDLKESNNQVTDEIVAEMRRSRFIVVECTGHRPAVYYEAGFMHGLGRPVIFLCRKDHLAQASFDTRQYSHIVWSSPEELRVALLRRIQATIAD